MVKVGLLSDTHGWLDPKIVEFFKDCNEVWHCGDIGDVAITDALAKRFTLHAVYGNIDTIIAPGLSARCPYIIEGKRTYLPELRLNRLSLSAIKVSMSNVILPQIYIIFLSTHDFRSEKDPVNQLFSLFFYSLKSITT